MNAYEVWKEIPEELHHEILDLAYTNNKKLYRHLLDEMGKQLRKRVVVLQTMPRQARHTLFHRLLTLPNFHILTQNLLMHWLAKGKSEMLVAFMDELNIPHDGTGCAEDFPLEVDGATITKGIEALYAKFPDDQVTLYLKTFDVVTGREWPEIEKGSKDFSSSSISEKVDQVDKTDTEKTETE